MAYFIVRIELHEASASDYTNLHAFMAAAGFTRTIAGSDGKRYELPTGMYFADLIAELTAVRDAADAAAARTGKARSGLVTQGSSAWKGLSVAASTSMSTWSDYR